MSGNSELKHWTCHFVYNLHRLYSLVFLRVLAEILHFVPVWPGLVCTWLEAEVTGSPK